MFARSIRPTRLASILIASSIILGACATATPAPTSAPAATAAQATAGSQAQATATTAGVAQATSTTAPAAQATATTAPAAQATSTSAPTAQGQKNIMTLGREGNNSFNRNFNPFSPNALPGTTTAIYERMLIYDTANGKTIPWLATDWKWGADGKSLTFTVGANIKWSDGTPFTANDVAYTFQLLKDKFAGGGFDYIASVTAPDDKTVVFTFTRTYSPALYEVGQQVIVPQHIWKDVADPTKSTNDNPVGTGPFTEVAVFQTQVFELDRNPYYWQAGKPYIDGIRYPAYTGNDQVQLGLVSGEIDWADTFIPDVAKTYVAKNPNYHYWYSPTGFTALLIMNTTKPPFADPVVRKAISMAINRDQIVKVGMSDYTHPTNDATGLSDSVASWLDPAAIPAGGDWTKFDVAKANASLDAAGYTKGADGIRLDKQGKPMKYEIIVGSTSTDWVANSQVIAQNLKAIGMDVTVGGQDWGLVIPRKQKGDFDMAHSWSGQGPTPYNFYRWTLSCDMVKPIGTLANENYARFCSKDATDLLHQFEATFDEPTQRTIISKLEKIFVDTAPSAPLFPSPNWGQYNTTRFTGFPDANNPYALLQNRDPGAVIVLTTVKPK